MSTEIKIDKDGGVTIKTENIIGAGWREKS